MHARIWRCAVKRFFPFVDGCPIEGTLTRGIRSPYDDGLVAEVSWGDGALVERAIEATILGARIMRDTALYRRQEILRRTSGLLSERADELAEIIAGEAGKPIRHARAEVRRAAVTFSLAAGEVSALAGEALPLDVSPNGTRRLGITRRMPIGAIAGITPFNFPLNLVAHKVAPALAAGNAIVVKPASATPISALRLAQILSEAGLPPGACNVVPCSAADAGVLVADERIAMVTFTGSAEVGWGVKGACGKKRVCLELGGNAAVIVEPDADLARAAKRIAVGGYAYAGQVCISVQRVFVHRSAWDAFHEHYLPEVNALKLGDPMDPATDIGPVINDAAASRIEQWVREAVDAGGRLLMGGKRRGRLVEATVLADVPESCRVVAEEAFAPLTVVQPYSSLGEALDAVNGSRFGLQAGIFTGRLDSALAAFDALHVGGVIVNDSSMFRVDSMPYGGVKDSGLGREGVASAIREMTEQRIMVVEMPQSPGLTPSS
ncbi:aldehyde dehydrogenase family protein [Candidatus Fermentibacteria bacterium]|nr:aldehyde dehydrogenase family protein [Candidatus Fermentibacteria bacterium]